mmetsp:Transcript_23910/g.56599  ORF Transcript_23910/g.56599 Transcript_23910/m.56599 type:complete len:121 (-) Transcript_23910:234-596(-)
MVQLPFLLNVTCDLAFLLRAFISGGVFENMLQLSLGRCGIATALAFPVELGRIDPPFPRAINICRRAMLLQTLAPAVFLDDFAHIMRTEVAPTGGAPPTALLILPWEAGRGVRWASSPVF